MKKLMLFMAVAAVASTALFAGAARRTAKRNGQQAPKVQKAVVDPITISRAEAMINTKRLLDAKIMTTNVVDAVTGQTNEAQFVRYHFRQAGVEWYEDKPRVEISGRVGPRRYSKLKLLYAAEAAGKAGQLKAVLSAKETPSGLTYWDLFNAAMYLREDDTSLMEGLRLIVETGLCTQEQLDTILQSALD